MNSVVEHKSKNELINIPKIRELCEQKSLAFAELGRRIGLNDRQKMNARLHNKSQISGDELFLISDALDVPVDDLRIK